MHSNDIWEVILMKKKKGDKDMEAILKQSQIKKEHKKSVKSSFDKAMRLNGKALEKLSRN